MYPLKVALITNTLYEESVPLAKHLSQFSRVDLHAIVTQTGAGMSMLFEDNSGWKSEKTGIRLPIGPEGLSEPFRNYLAGDYHIFALLFKYLKFYFPGTVLEIRRIARLLRQDGYDLLHFNGTSLLYYWLKLFLGDIPTVLTTHDPLLHLGERKLKHRFLRRLIIAQHAAQHILHSESQRSLFLQAFSTIATEDVHVIPMGIHEWLPAIPGNEKTDPCHILYFGRIQRYKGIEYLIDAAIKAQQIIPELKVTIAGAGPLYFDRQKITNNPRFCLINRYISNREAAALFRKATLIVCPYVEASQSGVILTAFAFRKPVIATVTGGIPEIIEEGRSGILVPPRQADALSRAMVELLQNPAKIQAMSEYIGRVSGHAAWNWDQIARQTWSVYLRAMESMERKE